MMKTILGCDVKVVVQLEAPKIETYDISDDEFLPSAVLFETDDLDLAVLFDSPDDESKQEPMEKKNN